ncbi:tyrosine-type recombinase/integrase [Methylobacterium sp. P31]
MALDCLRYAGLRRGDAARVSRLHVQDGRIRIQTEKTGEEVAIRILLSLAASISASPVGELTFIASERGRPMTVESFGNRFRDACAAVGVPGRAHNLRKAGARRAVESKAMEAELDAWFGWAEGSRQSASYVRGANRTKRAERIADRWNGEATPAPQHPVGGEGRKASKIKMLVSGWLPEQDSNLRQGD